MRVQPLSVFAANIYLKAKVVLRFLQLRIDTSKNKTNNLTLHLKHLKHIVTGVPVNGSLLWPL